MILMINLQYQRIKKNIHFYEHKNHQQIQSCLTTL